MASVFSLAPQNVTIRNAQVKVKKLAADALTDIGLVANVKVEYKPINVESSVGAVTQGYDVTVTAEMLQTAIADVSAALGLAGIQTAEIDFIGDTDKIVLLNFMLNPAGAIDFNGAESKVTLAGHQKMTTAAALALQVVA